MSNLEEFKRKMALQAFGMTKEEAHIKKICISCKRPAWKVVKTDADLAEYRVSGLCGECFEDITGEF